jgi:hypothetical protein
MIGFLWRLLGRRLGWLAIGALGRFAVRAMTEREVNKVADQLDERLPASVRAAADRLPGDPIKSGAQAVVAGRSLRRAANGSARAAKAANDGRRAVSAQAGRAGAQVGRLADRAAAVGELRQEVRRESELARRELHAHRLQVSGAGRAAADDALLDRRSPTESLDLGVDDPHADGDAAHPLDRIPEPVTSGRRRFRARPEALVQRVQRSYRKPTRPWDR